MAQVLIIFFFVFALGANDVFKVKSFKELKYQDVIPQTYEESCGASSLSTLMNLYDANVTEKDLLSDLNTTDMVNFLDLQSIANINGFKAKVYSITQEIFEQLQFPVIARVLRHKDYPHFIVVQNLEGDFVLSYDPNDRKRIVTKNEFYSVWNKEDNGYILVVLPNNEKKLKKLNFLDTSLLLIN